MNTNILKTKDYVKIYIQYINDKSIKVRKTVSVKYIDLQSCYLAMPLPSKIERPKPKTKAKLIVYTEDGIYTSDVNFIGSEVTLNELFYEVTVPSVWQYKQSRNGSRKNVELSVNIIYDDGFEISAQSIDLSSNGISFKTSQRISTIYHRLKSQLTLQLPKDLIINCPDGKFICNAAFVRLKENFNTNEKVYAFKFLNASKDDIEVLQKFLMRIL